MPKTAQQRRADRLRKERARQQHRPHPAPRSAGPPDPVLMLVVEGAQLAQDEKRAAAALDAVVAELVRRDAGLDTAGHALTSLISQLSLLWEAGWQPADVLHVSRRRLSQRAARLAGVAVRAEALAGDAAGRAPLAWVDQLADLPATPTVASWALAEGIDRATAWRDVLRLLGGWLSLPRLEHLLPPPSAWPRRRAEPTRGADGATDRPGVDDKVLGRVRALLAKAESTDFDEEADTYTAKAQQLIARYEIDAAVLADRRPAGQHADVGARRVHLTDPYAEPKASLVDAVARANGARVVLLGEFGIATVIGLPADLELVELLYTSLLLQVNRALTATARAGSSRTRTPSFRRGFLYSYAARVGERLADARDEAVREAGQTYGSALVPVLARKAEAVDDAVQELFPHTVHKRGRSVDAAGWRAGRLAAEQADLGTGRQAVARDG